MDLIAIDIGNTTVSLGVFAKSELKQSESVDPADSQKLSEALKVYREICGPQAHGARTVPIIASSVNPEYQKLVEKTVLDTFNQDIKLIGRDFPLNMKVAVEDIDSVGSDRLLAAMAAYEVVEGAVAVADFGSATTVDLVNDSGIFLGGVIMPGLSLSAKALHDYTAALPLVKPAVPEGNYGTNTEKACNAGIYYGAVGALREVIERYATELGTWPQVVLSGGHSRLISQQCDFADSLVPDLCLDGLYLAYATFRESQESDELA